MAITVTTNWTDFEYQRGVSARLSYIVTGATSADQALTASGIPVQNSLWPSDFRLLAQMPVVTMLGPAPVYRVEVNWVRPSGDSKTDTEDPLETPLIYAWNIGNSAINVNEDAEGNPLVNSVGIPFDPPEQRDLAYEELTIVRNESTFNPVMARAYRNKINDAPFLGGDAETVRCLTIRPMGDYPVGALYVPVGYTFRFQPDGFKHRRVDQGYCAWYFSNDGNTQLGQFYYATNEKVPIPVNLDGKGKPIETGYFVSEDRALALAQRFPKGANKMSLLDDSIVVLEWPQYKKASFAALGLE